MRALLAAVVVCALARSASAEIASCYGREHHQVRTATGASYDPSRLTAAHRSLPFGTRVRVCNLSRRASGVGGAAASAPRCVIVTVNDRGPAAWTHRAIDLSLGACRAIGNSGLARVFLQIVGGPHEAHIRLRARRHLHRHRG
jgi:rare lipoprotein A